MDSKKSYQSELSEAMECDKMDILKKDVFQFVDQQTQQTPVECRIFVRRSLVSNEDEVVPPQPPSRELRVDEIDQYISTESGLDTLRAEFHSIEDGQRKPWTVGSLPENMPKNRYNDLLPYDETRVVLEPLPGDPYSDYINANYINGHDNQEKEYVVTQGPLPNTIDDFWRMVWQLNSSALVVLANLVEHGESKVAKYWPDDSSTYGDITVAKVSEYSIPSASHVIRTFSIEKKGYTEPRRLRQFHYTGWPDLGVPSDTLPVIAILLQARKYKGKDTAPLIVHCSAGVGRTGTVVLTDSMIQRAKAYDTVDFPRRLNEMRLQRVDVVEREAQYIFAHEAVYKLFYGNNTAEYLDDIDNQYNNAEETS